LLRSLSAAHIRSFILGAKEVDIAELKTCVTYDRGYHVGHRMIRMFWNCVENELSDAQRRKLLLFWTASSVPPSSGFAESGLRDGFDSGDLVISRMSHLAHEMGESKNAIGALPEAATCNKNLFLPEYPSAQALKKALLMAIEFCALGFDRL
jgi:E3 ubiquitin-protein ligase HUWE1